MEEEVTDPEVDHQEEAVQRRATGCILEVITSCKIFKILVSIIHNNEFYQNLNTLLADVFIICKCHPKGSIMREAL